MPRHFGGINISERIAIVQLSSRTDRIDFIPCLFAFCIDQLIYANVIVYILVFYCSCYASNRDFHACNTEVTQYFLAILKPRTNAQLVMAEPPTLLISTDENVRNIPPL